VDPLAVLFGILALGKPSRGNGGGKRPEPAPGVPSPAAYIDPSTGDIIDPGVTQASPGMQPQGQWSVPSPPPAPPPPFKMPPPGDITPMAPVVPSAPPAPPATAPQVAPWPAVVPAGLPPFPGSGWVPVSPLTQGIIDRASYWNSQLWDFSSRRIVQPYAQEQFGGEMLTFAAKWHPGPGGAQTYMATEAYRLASGPAAVTPAVPITPAPVIAPPVPAMPPDVPPPTPPTAPPVVVNPFNPPLPPLVGPEPAPGAWRSDHAFIARYQTALTYLASLGNPGWDPQGDDGIYGPHTAAAVKAFQSDQGLAPADGQVGNVTAARIDTLLGANAQNIPQGP